MITKNGKPQLDRSEASASVDRTPDSAQPTDAHRDHTRNTLRQGFLEVCTLVALLTGYGL